MLYCPNKTCWICCVASDWWSWCFVGSYFPFCILSWSGSFPTSSTHLFISWALFGNCVKLQHLHFWSYFRGVVCWFGFLYLFLCFGSHACIWTGYVWLLLSLMVIMVLLSFKLTRIVVWDICALTHFAHVNTWLLIIELVSLIAVGSYYFCYHNIMIQPVYELFF